MSAIGTERPNEEEEAVIDELCSVVKVQDKTSFLAYQYIVKAVK